MSDPHTVLCCGCNRYVPEEDTERDPETFADFCDGCWQAMRDHERAMDEEADVGAGCLIAAVCGFIAWAGLLSALGLVCWAIWGPWWEQ